MTGIYNVKCFQFNVIYVVSLTIRMSTPTAMNMTLYQCCSRNFLRLAMLSSDRRIFLRVASGPEGSTCEEKRKGYMCEEGRKPRR